MKTKLSELSSALIKFHRELLFFQVSLAEDTDQRKYTPYELLGLSLNDPRFAWLRKFSELITQIDTITDDKENTPFDARAIFDEAQTLILGENSGISEQYNLALKTEPSLIVKLLDVKKALAAIEPDVKSLHEAHLENQKKKYTH